MPVGGREKKKKKSLFLGRRSEINNTWKGEKMGDIRRKRKREKKPDLGGQPSN